MRYKVLSVVTGNRRFSTRVYAYIGSMNKTEIATNKTNILKSVASGDTITGGVTDINLNDPFNIVGSAGEGQFIVVIREDHPWFNQDLLIRLPTPNGLPLQLCKAIENIIIKYTEQKSKL